MIVTAFVASRMNLVYGWDFNGILVPAFIAMLWNQPARILATFVEAFAVLFAAQALLRLPLFQRTTMEKGRQILLFFTVSFAYKALLGFTVPFFFPESRITDFFGFGYVLCSLIAMRIHSRQVGVKLTSCTLQTSFVSMVLATGVGFALAQAQATLPWLTTAEAARGEAVRPVPPPRPATAGLEELFHAQRVGMYGVRTQRLYHPPLPGDLERFERAVTLLVEAGAAEGDASRRAAELLGEIDYELLRLENRFWLLQERASRRGWGFFVLDSRSPNQLLVEVPAPMEERGTCAGGYRLFRLLEARALSSATNLRRPGGETALDPLLASGTFLAVFHRVVGRSSTLQVRGSGPGGVPRLRVKRELPEGLDLAAIEARTGSLGTRWAPPEERNFLAELSRTRFAELSLPPRIFLHLEPSASSDALAVPLEERTLRALLAGSLAAVSPEGSERYTPPAVDELLFLDEEVLAPLLALLDRTEGFDPLRPEDRQDLAPLASSAALHGYALRVLSDPTTRQRLVVLDEEPGSPRRWGTYVYLAGPAENVAVQVPRPGLEAGTLETGLWAFDRLKARMLAVAGALPLTRKDLRSDVNRVADGGNLFALATQVLLRESGDAPGLVLHVRGISNRADVPLPRIPEGDLLLREAHNGDGARAALVGLTSRLEAAGFRAEWLAGQEVGAGLRVESIPAARYIRASVDKALVAAWISPSLRRDFQDLRENLALSQKLRAAGLPPEEEDLASRLAESSPSVSLPAPFLSELHADAESGDVLRLDGLRRRWAGLDLRCRVDRSSGRPYLVAGSGGSIGAVASIGSEPRKELAWKTVPSRIAFEEARALLAARTVRIRREAGR
jgi:hypothetical protein